jgi:hypothetical protein
MMIALGAVPPGWSVAVLAVQQVARVALHAGKSVVL